MIRIFTQGYEGKSIDEFIEKLRTHGAKTVVDVRLTPISRKKGFSKTKFRQHLQEAGVEYLHVRALGNPKEFRVKASTAQECLDMYRDYMEPRWNEALVPVIEAAHEAPICLVCMERDHNQCHRNLVAEELLSHLPGAHLLHI